MCVKGKIYGKYLKRAKYVVKGRKLKTPIATIQKRVVEVKQNDVNEQKDVQVNNNDYKATPVNKVMENKPVNNVATLPANSTVIQNKNNIVTSNNKKGGDTSFSDLGKKIVEDEGNENNKKSDSKTFMIVAASLAIIILAGMFQIGSYVYSEMKPNTKVASNKEVNNTEKKNNTETDVDYNSDNELLTETQDIEATPEPSEEPEATDAPQATDKLEDEKKKDNKENTDSTVKAETSNVNTTSTNKVIVNNNNILESFNKPGTIVKPNETKEDKPSKPPINDIITAGEDNRKYTEIGNVSSACELYHIKGTSVRERDITKYKYSDVKFDNGKVKVLSTDLYGMFFYNNGNDTILLKAYQSGVPQYVNTVTLKEKNDDKYVTIDTYYVIDGGYIDLNDEYVLDPNSDEDGKKQFCVISDMVLYKN